MINNDHALCIYLLIYLSHPVQLRVDVRVSVYVGPRGPSFSSTGDLSGL